MLVFAFILIVLGSICNAVMDILDHHQSKSIFAKFRNPLWWNSDEGWRNKYVDRDPAKGRVKWFGTNINKPVQLTDAWHFFKMLMIIFLNASMVTALYVAINFEWYWFPILLLGAGTAWNLTFSLFYNKILRVKQ